MATEKKKISKAPAKKPAAKKPAAKKPAAKKSAAKRPEGFRPRKAKRIPSKNSYMRIVSSARKSIVIAKNPPEQIVPSMDRDEAMAFAMSIAEEMKRRSSAAVPENSLPGDDIRLSRRPTTRSQGKSTVKFPAADLKEFRRRLIEAREKALNGIDAMRATGFNESDDHEVDGGDGTNQTLRLQALGQMGNIKRMVQQIEEALHRIDDGTYGVCTVCGQLIRKPRLVNQPFVLTCMECQNEMERNRRG